MPSLLVTPSAPNPGPHLATEREMEALVYIAASRVPVLPGELGRDLALAGEGLSKGACRDRAHVICRRLGYAALIGFDGQYVLTERGRIAAAIVMCMRPGLRAGYFGEGGRG